MELTIRGGVRLDGEVTVRGAKNTVPKNLVASVLSDEPSILRNIARVSDVDIVRDAFDLMGVATESVKTDPTALAIDPRSPRKPDPAGFSLLASKSRIPILLAGPMLHRLGEALMPTLGGCRIGARPVDYHVAALEALGAEAEVLADGSTVLRADRLKGTKITLPYPSVGATEQVLLAGVLATGTTTLQNAAIEPEIMDLIAMLQVMGADISVEPDRRIVVRGVARLHGYDHRAMPDRLEAASWACAAAATGGQIFVKSARQLDMMTFLNMYRRIGGDFDVLEDGIVFRFTGPPQPIALSTDVHPGFATDWHPPFAVVLMKADGISILHETVYEDRLGYLRDLQMMNAKVQTYTDCLIGGQCRMGDTNAVHSAVIAGPSKLVGARIRIPDLRAGFSYVIAALAAEGESTISNVELLERGYESFVDKLRGVGAEFDVAV